MRLNFFFLWLVLVLTVTVQAVAQNGFRNSAGNVLAFDRWPTTNAVLNIGTTGSPINPTNKNLRLQDFFRGSNQVWRVGDWVQFQGMRATEPANLLFADSGHSSHGVLVLGGLSGDVVANPTTADGLFQIGATGNPGSYHYLQYANTPTTTAQSGFSHPLEFRSRMTNTATGGGYFTQQGGIVGFPYGSTAGTLSELRFYAKAPHWAAGNNDATAPTVAGVEVFRVNTNNITATWGVRFVGDGSGLTNISGLGGGSEVTTNILVRGADDLEMHCFTSGSLTAVYPLESESATFFAAVTNSGGTLNTAQKRAVDVFVKNRKGIIGRHVGTNTWTDADRIAIMLGGTISAATNYLKGGSDGIVYNGGPTYTAGGVQFDGSNDYGNTGFDADSASFNYTQDSCRFIMVIPASSASSVSVNNQLTASANGTSRAGFFCSLANFYRVAGINANVGSGPGVSATDIRGIWVGKRTASNAEGILFWKNDVAIGGAVTVSGSDTVASSAIPGEAWYIGARNFAGSPDNYSAFTMSGWEVGAGVSDAVAQLIRDDWAQLQSELGR